MGFFKKWLYVYCQNYSYRDFCDKKLNECCENVCTVCRNDIKRNGLLQFFFRDLIFLFPSQIGAFLFLKRFLSFIRHLCWICIMYTEGIFAPSYLQLSFRNKVVFKKIFNTLYLNWLKLDLFVICQLMMIFNWTKLKGLN